MKIVFVRHGYSTANRDCILSGITDVQLSEEGIEKLIELKNTVTYPETDFYVTTNLVRTQETFNILYEGKKIDKIESRFCEINMGDYEAKTFVGLDVNEYFGKIYQDQNISNNETATQLFERVEEGLIDLIYELREKNLNSATVVSHSYVMRLLAAKANDGTLETFLRIRPKNGMGFIFDIDVDNNGKIIFNSFEEIK